MTPLRRSRCTAAALILSAGSVFAAAPGPGAEQLESGRRIYQEGLLPSGEAVTAAVRGDVVLSGEIVICGTCHRLSGMGSSEGEQVIPAVAGQMLFNPLSQPTSKPPAAPLQRPAYDNTTLKRAIREGIDANGEPMDPLMPRYALADADLDLLIDYLQTLSAEPSPGVDERDIHFATILAGPVAPDVRKALVDVMQTYVEQKNRETRYESKRKETPMWHKQWLFAPYRKWVMHVWELEGPSETWGAQLDSLYAQQPVFAVLSGVAEGSWRPMHEFCEAARLPCLFPTTDLPVIAEDDFYSVYLSKGMALEGQLISRHRRDRGEAVKPLLQVYREGDTRAQTAAAALQSSNGEGLVPDMVWRGEEGAAPDAAFWQRMLDESQGADLVLWLSAGEAGALWPVLAQRDGSGPRHIYLSTTLSGVDPEAVPLAFRERVFLVHPSELPSRQSRLLARSTGWFRVKHIYAPQAGRVQANAYFALKVVGDALVKMRGYFFRDYLIERIEHMLDSVPYTSIYPRISLAPEQRFAAKGGYITQISGSQRPELIAVTDWLTP